MTIDRKTVYVLIAAVAFGWWMSSHNAPQPPQPDRPVRTWLARLARFGLWVMLIGEQPPQPEQRFVHAKVDADGNRLLNNAEGW